jgi:hypothetical protein
VQELTTDSGEVRLDFAPTTRDTLNQLIDDVGRRRGQRTGQEVLRPTDGEITLQRKDTGRIITVRDSRAADLLETGDFQFIKRSISPRERTRIRRAREANERRIARQSRGGQVQQTLQEFGVADIRSTGGRPDLDTPSESSGLSIPSLGRRGSARLQSPLRRIGGSRSRDLDGRGGLRESIGDVFEERGTRRGRDVFPEAEFVDILGAGRRAPDIRGGSLLSVLDNEAGTRVDEPLLSVENPQGDGLQGGLVSGLEEEILSTGGGVSEIFEEDTDQDTGVSLRQSQGQSQRQRQRTQTRQKQEERTDTRVSLFGRRRGTRRQRSSDSVTPRGVQRRVGGGSGSGDGFTALVKSQGEFREIGVFDTEKEARSAAEELVDVGTERSFKVEFGGEPVDLSGNKRYRKSKAGGGVLVEKAEFAIDSDDEISGITRVGNDIRSRADGVLGTQNGRRRGRKRQGGSRRVPDDLRL